MTVKWLIQLKKSWSEVLNTSGQILLRKKWRVKIVDQSARSEYFENGPKEGNNIDWYSSHIHNRLKYLDDYMVDSKFDNNIKYIVHYCCSLLKLSKKYQEAIISTDSNQWQKLIEDEMNVLKENNTYVLVPLSTNRTAVGETVGTIIKPSITGKDKYKGRIVLKGYLHIPDVNYHQIFSLQHT